MVSWAGDLSMKSRRRGLLDSDKSIGDDESVAIDSVDRLPKEASSDDAEPGRELHPELHRCLHCCSLCLTVSKGCYQCQRT
jgi:hypothetical protein